MVGKYPPVILSYQSASVDFMIKLRAFLNANGVETADGQQVPAGQDWRRFWFLRCKKAHILIPILCGSMLFSQACEDEITYAKDNGKVFLPVVCNPDYQDIIDNPEKYLERPGGEDIESRVCKISSFLNVANRVPANGKFQDNFEANAQNLLARIQERLKQFEPQPEHAGDTKTYEVDKECSIEALVLKALADQDLQRITLETDEKEHNDQLTLLHAHLFPKDHTEPAQEMCSRAMQTPSKVGYLCQMLETNLDDERFRNAAAQCVKALCFLGGSSGEGLLNFRLEMSKRKNAVKSLLDMVAAENRGRGVNHTQHVAILALAYLTRCKTGKLEVYDQGGIAQFTKVIEPGDLITGSMDTTLQILWNLVYIDMYESTRADQILNAVPEIVKYLNSGKATITGRSRSYFIFSHVCHRHAKTVSESGVMQYLIEDLNTFSAKPHENRQLLEGACRLLASLARNQDTRQCVMDDKVVDTLLRLFEVREEDLAENERLDTECAQDRPPKDAYKMRAAEALNHLCSGCEEGCAGEDQIPSVQSLQQRLVSHIGVLSKEDDRSKHHPVETMMWLSIQPSINREIIQSATIMDQLWKMKDAISDYYDSTWSDCRYDLIILLVATIRDKDRLFELMDVHCDRNHTVFSFMLNVQSCRYPLSQETGHTMCSRWAAMCKAIQLITTPHENECRIDVQQLGQGRGRDFYNHLVPHIMRWLEHGHPYKEEGEKVMNIIAAERTAFHYIVQYLMSNCTELLHTDTLNALETVDSLTPGRGIQRMPTGRLESASTHEQLSAVKNALKNLCHR